MVRSRTVDKERIMHWDRLLNLIERFVVVVSSRACVLREFDERNIRAGEKMAEGLRVNTTIGK